ncbi:WD40 repeat-like protein [Rhizoclosmatium globosum]|uniref:WD40 repeat-like protein n=1 Tax=Rhizoclosmatium globosum TaxID=329046 RepID=A0A1Y2AGK5_9FUNG|nr:WD40 repeat-like protein [Rhizoclosmatium globosum]|eukprot:ORY21584.1 WD40 repeat-like protein [Rhizoclosmatium globosum]
MLGLCEMFTKPSSILNKVSKSIGKLCFIPRYSVYAACSDEKAIRTSIISRFHSFNSHSLLYNPHLHQLIAISSHVITTWAMKAIVFRGTLTIDMTLRSQTEISLPPTEWITSATFDTHTTYIHILVSSKVLVYDSTTLMELDSWLSISSRQVTCLVTYHPYGFTVVGCKDGSVKVLNSANVLVHEFQSQYKPVTAVAVYPYGPVVVASAMDKTVRMYNLRTFKEVYCLQLQDKPLDMHIMDENSMCLMCTDSVMVWSLNHINTQFCSINARPLKIRNIESMGTPSRILARSEDEVIRLISPNPEKTDKLIYNLVGDVVHRQQLHFGNVTCIANDMEQDILVTAGDDNVINVTHFNPGAANMFEVKVAIETEHVPKDISDNLDDTTSAIEDPISFDEDFNFKLNFAASHVPCKDSANDLDGIDFSWLEGSNPQSESKMHFMTMNFAIDSYSEAKIKTRKEAQKEQEQAYQALMDKLAVITERRRKIVDSAKRRIELENLEIEKRDNILHEEFEKFQRYKEILDIEPSYLRKSRWQTGSFYEMAPEEKKAFLKDSDDEEDEEYVPPKYFDDDQLRFQNYEFEVVKPFDDDFHMDFLAELLPSSPEPADLELAVEAMIEEQVIQEPENPVSTSQRLPQQKSKSETSDQDKKKEEFKAKIQEMLKKKQEDERLAEEKAEAERKAREAAGAAEPEKPPEEPVHEKAPSRGKTLQSRPVTFVAPQQPQKYPKIIEQLLQYSWFPEDEIFYPKIEKAQSMYIKKEKKDDELRQSVKKKTEMFDYMTWIYQEMGNKDTTMIIRALCRYLQINPFFDLDEDEKRLYSPIETIKNLALAELFNIGWYEEYHDLFLQKLKDLAKDLEPSLLTEAVAFNKAKKGAPTAKQLLLAGASTLTTPPNKGTPPFLQRNLSPQPSPHGSTMQLTGLPPRSPSTGPSSGPNYTMELRNQIMTFLRKGFRKFLIRTAKDDETLGKLLELNESGMLDKNKQSIEEKAKEDKEMVAQREKDRGVPNKPAASNAALATKAAAPGGKKGGKKNSITKDLLVAGNKGGKRVSVDISASPSKLPQTESKRPKSANSIDILYKMAPANPTQIGLTRNALIALQTPTILDFIGVMNMYSISLDRKMKREQKEYLEKIAREARIAEEQQKEREKLEAMAEYMRLKEAERIARAQMLKDKIAAKEAEKAAAKLAAEMALIKKPTKAFKGFTGPTHVSKCHPSRETLDTTLPCMHRHDHSLGTTMLANHFNAINRSMPVEHIQLNPFGYNDGHAALQAHHNQVTLPPLAPPRIQRKVESQSPKLPILMSPQPKKSSTKSNSSWRLPSFYDAPDAIDYINPNVDGGVTLSQELEYIRKGPKNIEPIYNSIGQPIADGRATYFTVGRKYFMVDLTEPDDVDDVDDHDHHHHRHTDAHGHNHTHVSHHHHNPHGHERSKASPKTQNRSSKKAGDKSKEVTIDQ